MKKNMLVLCMGLLVSACTIVDANPFDGISESNQQLLKTLASGSGVGIFGTFMSKENNKYTREKKKPDNWMDIEKIGAIAGMFFVWETMSSEGNLNHLLANLGKLGAAGLGFAAYNSETLNYMCNKTKVLGFIADPVNKDTGEVFKGAGSFLRGALVLGLGRYYAAELLPKAVTKK